MLNNEKTADEGRRTPLAYRRRMDVGILTLGDWIADPATGVRTSAAARHRQIVEQAVVAEGAGFRSIHLGEHHFSEYILTSPPVVLAAIAERTSTLRLSNGVALAANLDPVRVAEDYATVDVLSGGRMEPCFGRGSIFPDVYTFFGQSADDATARFAENVRLVDRLWRSDGPIDWEGEFRAPLTGVEVHPRPAQTPPPIWIGGGWSPDTVDLAVELGAGLMLPTVIGTWEMFRPSVDRYVEGWEAAGRDPADRRIGCCSHVWVDADAGRARRTWAPRYLRYLERVGDWQRMATRRAGRADARFPAADFDTMTSTVALCGSPDQVVDRIGTAREVLRLDTQLFMLDMGGVPDDELFGAIELAGDRVLPQLA